MPAPQRFVGLIVALLLVTGCAASDQPYFVDDVELSDPVIDSVVARLDRAADAVFTAEYSIITKLVTGEQPPSLHRTATGVRSPLATSDFS